MASVTETVAALGTLQASHQPSLLRLVEPFAPQSAPTELSPAHPVPTPQSLAADLAHYQTLFSKLRFSYLEQVTKEKFLRSIVGDPPLIVENGECAELEARLVSEKARLKRQKQDVAGLVEQLEATGVRVTSRHAQLQADGRRLAVIEHEIAESGRQIEERRRQLPEDPEDPNGWPLARVRSTLEIKREECDSAIRQLQVLRDGLPQLTGELEAARREVQQLEAQRQGSIAAAEVAKRRKEGRSVGGSGDEVEERARWLRAQEAILKNLLEIP